MRECGACGNSSRPARLRERHPLSRGLEARAAHPHNSGMKKQAHVFGWEEEPVDERPSEFMASTGYSVLSGYYPIDELRRPPLAPRPRSRIGFKTLLLACVVVLALGAYALAKVVPLLHG